MRISWTLHDGAVDVLFRLLLLLMIAWLVWAIVQVNIEFDDGYGAFANTAHFLGTWPDHFFNGGPLLAIALIPAKLLKDAFGLHPLDVRVAHAQMALLHVAYLVATWRLLSQVHGRTAATLLAYLAAIVTPVFFSYAPFLNIDIFPGALALWMVFLVDRQLTSPSPGRWSGLVVLGAALPLIKQSYALVWIGIVATLPLLLLAQRADRRKWLTLCSLILAAALSGLITWFAYGASLATPFGAEPIWWRPWLQIQAISSMYDVEGGAWQVFHPWIYLQNLWAYGILAMLLVVPGVLLALVRGSSFERLVAMFWLFEVAMLHLTPYKEVRYLAFLAPFTAVLLVPVLRLIWAGGRRYRWAVLGVLGAGFVLAVPEALRLRDPYYREAMLEFLQPLPTDQPLPGRLIMGGPLSFVSPEAQAFFADRYHRITHIMPQAIIAFYGYPSDRLWQIKSTADVRADAVRPGDIWLLTTSLLTRTRPFVRGNHPGLDQDFFQLFAIAEAIDLVHDQAGYRIQGAHPRSPYLLVGSAANVGPLMVAEYIDEITAISHFGWTEPPASTQVIAFRILRRCALSGCTRFD